MKRLSKETANVTSLETSYSDLMLNVLSIHDGESDLELLLEQALETYTTRFSVTCVPSSELKRRSRYLNSVLRPKLQNGLDIENFSRAIQEEFTI